MCRLTAWAGRRLPLDRLLFGGEHSLLRQSWAPRELLSGSVNADGWGVAWYPDTAVGDQQAEAPGDGPAGTGAEPTAVRLARVEPPWYDPDLPGLLASTRAPLALAALRNATPGLPVDRSGLLPLVRGRHAFVLNGWVPDFRLRHMRALRTTLPDELYGALEGVSDAETLFLLAVALIDGGGASPLEALGEVAARVADRLRPGQEAPLTMVLASPAGLAALNTSAGGGPCNSLYVSSRTALAPAGTLLASERLDEDDGWEPVGAHGWVVIARDGSVERGISRAGRPPA